MGRLEVAVSPQTQILMLLVSKPCWCGFYFLGRYWLTEK